MYNMLPVLRKDECDLGRLRYPDITVDLKYTIFNYESIFIDNIMDKDNITIYFFKEMHFCLFYQIMRLLFPANYPDK